IREAGGSDAARGKQDINAAPGAKVEHRLSGVEVDQSRRIAAAERGEYRLFGKLAVLAGGVKVFRDGVAAAHGRITASRRAGSIDIARNGSVLVLDIGLCFHVEHLVYGKTNILDCRHICQGIYLRL